MKIKLILIFGLVLPSHGGSEKDPTNSSGNEDLVKAINEIKANYQKLKKENDDLKIKIKSDNQELKNKITELDNKMQTENQSIKEEYQKLKKEYDDLKLKVKSDNQELKNQITELDNKIQNNSTLEKRLNQVEELSKIKLLRTCEELARHGISTDGLYTIDPDGELIGYDPIEVYCAFDVDGNVVTEVKHFQDNVIEAEKCKTPRCFNKTIDYGVPLAQIEALVSLSETCWQTLSFGCFLAPLFDNGEALGGWRDRNGKLNFKKLKRKVGW